MFLKRNILRFVRNLLCFVITLFLIIIYLEQRYHKTSLLVEIPESAYKFISFEQRGTQHLDITTLKRLIKSYNEAERIHNNIDFGPGLNDSTVIVIFVHKISVHLKYLIASLSNIQGIQDVLVIFSHAFYDININKLIEQIDFCRVLQIFYPYSIQLYPNVFPGNDEQQRRSRSVRRACLGSCIDRNSQKAEKKHHWWWTANMVFENLSSVDVTNGNIVFFLNEDQYLLEDFLYMVIYMKKAAKSMPQCEMISLGTIGSNNIAVGRDTYRLELTTWNPKYHSDVLGFDLSTWNTIVSHFDLFCLIDDYSWARSLQYISLNRLEGNKFKVISSKVPRSFTTNCGAYDLTNCGEFEGIYKALHIQKLTRSNMFPPLFEIKNNVELIDDIDNTVTESNGGWNDIRDREFCSNMTISKVKKLLLDMKTQFM
ncbi:unnamed protein product [Pieris macdunnoughi]|uniref:Alpha-1,6-mannosyl-glycoprotein 2-beta-N-acetylglucosaminyltransferase n=1 Tax=Pieris macdunnoughi TaxID=345717 RepID=A0A821PUQ8_9NEOP|nr:unnamed protein product [Pieris macdunnoughi]